MNKLPKFISEQIYLIFYIVSIGIGLVIAILMLTSTVNKSPISNSGLSQNSALNFDQNTINLINNLKGSEDLSVAPILPSGRNNPFSE